MKKRKILNSLIALTCVATLGLSVITGCNKEPECEHVYTWTVHEGDESTCSIHGKETGVCGICGDIQFRELELDPSAHTFTGEWKITNPTETEKGVAIKTCAANPEHVVSVELPAVTITGRGYTSKEFIVKPTTTTAGEIKLTLDNEYGEIAFTAPLSKRTLNNMDDAVVLASSFKENIRSCSGTFSQSENSTNHSFSYYFGDDYTYIFNGADNEEFWYSYDKDGKIFAMNKKENGEATVITNPDENMFKGLHYNTPSRVSTFYGAEEGLAQLYEFAMNAKAVGKCVDYKESEVKPDLDGSVKDVKFSYSYYDGWFYRYNVTFSTFSDGTLEKLDVATKTIRSYMFVTESDGVTPVFYKGGESYTDNSGITKEHPAGDIVFGYVYPADEGGGNAYETYETIENDKLITNYVYEQKDALGRLIYEKHTDSGVEYYAVTYENEYSDNPTINLEPLSGKPEGLEYVYVKDAYGMEIVDSKGEKIKKIMAKGCYPVNSYYSDDHPEVNIYSVTFNQVKKVEGEAVKENEHDSESLYISSFDVLTATIDDRTVDVVNNAATLPTNKVVKFNISNVLPATASLKSDAISSIYVVDQVGKRIKLDNLGFNNGSQYKIMAYFTQSENTVTVNSQYAGNVKLLLVTQSGKCEKELNLTFQKSAPTSLSARAEVYSTSGGVPSYVYQGVDAGDNGVKLVVGQSIKFKAVAPDSEAAYVSTDIYPYFTTVNGAATEGLTLSKVDVSSYAEWELIADKVGEYMVEMPYFDGNSASTKVVTRFKVTVVPKQNVMTMLSGKTFSGTVKILNAGEPIPTSKKFTAVFAADGKLTVTVGAEEILYTYGVDGSGKLTTVLKSSPSTDKAYNFTFTINEADDLVVTHSTGLHDNTEEVVLTKQGA